MLEDRILVAKQSNDLATKVVSDLQHSTLA